MSNNSNEEEIDVKAKSELKRLLLPIILFTAFLGIVISAVESITKFIGLAQEQFYIVTFIFWVSFILVIISTK